MYAATELKSSFVGVDGLSHCFAVVEFAVRGLSASGWPGG